MKPHRNYVRNPGSEYTRGRRNPLLFQLAGGGILVILGVLLGCPGLPLCHIPLKDGLQSGQIPDLFWTRGLTLVKN